MANNVTFSFTDGWQKFNVPAGVKFVDVIVKGGSASAGDKQGGRVEGKLKVDGKDVLFIVVGRRGIQNTGASGGDACFGGGGAGGDGHTGKNGGDGGGGASYIRMNAKDGRIACVAGGAGGASGDGGEGGRGGASTGEHGSPSGAGSFGNSTGGTQAQPGRGGTSGSGTAYDGRDGVKERLGRGGQGGGPSDRAGVHGGGGGGGGFYPGGGGQAADVGVNPGGGGAGGSNYTGGLASSTSAQGGGGTDHGEVKISWLDPDDPNNPPVPPDNITIEGQPISPGLATKAKGKVTLKGTPDDPDQEQGVRIVVRSSRDKDFARYRTDKGTYDAVDHRDVVVIDNLEKNTLYYLRIYTQDKHQRLSTSYRATSFWTNRPPSDPTLVSPVENAQIDALINIPFSWTHHDPDPSDSQTAFRLKWRKAGTPSTPAGDWSVPVEQVTGTNGWVGDAGTWKGNTFYEWTVATRDEQDVWGTYATPASFYVTADATPPIPVSPIRGTAIVATEDNRFDWKFRGPQDDASQTHADIRYRPVGTPDWIELLGNLDPDEPGSNPFWILPAETFETGLQYEWQVRSYNVAGPASDWSDSEVFWTTAAPGSGAGIVVVETGLPAAPLGVGKNRVLIYDRGGQTYRGELTPLFDVKWARKRDDISSALIHLTEWTPDSAEFLENLHTWMHEMVIFRDNGSGPERVWEGPLTRIQLQRGNIEIEAQDVMAYVKRRIIRQGYNDSYRVLNGQQIGLHTVVERATQIILNALAYDDPNVIPYLTPLYQSGDARQSQVVKDYQTTAWQQVDDMAALNGLDYGISGRRIMLWDTHVPLGRLPEMRDGDFSDPPIVTEYGMSAANYFAVTNTNGVWGAAERGVTDMDPGPTGWIEQLASSYGENDGAASDRTVTKAALKQLQEAMEDQADRNISGRWPPPVVVRVPDNSFLSPELNIGINQLIPGVWIPVRASIAVREFAQWQKLDSVTVTESKSGEKISIVMSPAPNGGQDPDAEVAAEEE